MKMATTTHIFSLYILLITFFSFLVVQTSSFYDKEITSKFLNDFLGSKKGDKVKGLVQIKNYLVKYGYLNHNPAFTTGRNIADEGFEVLDDDVEEAIRKYQLFFHLNVTGVLDEHTLSLMTKPRCGVPDFINGKNNIKHGMKLVLDHPTKRSYYMTRSKWDKLNLTWATKPGMRNDARKPIFSALRQWELVTRFHFVQSNHYENSDLKIAFYSGKHEGDGQPFDGPGGIGAHATYPPNGQVHFDADENWVIGAVPGRIDIQSVALHELGHAIGLGHSTVEAAAMWPYTPVGVIKQYLNQDDIAGIKALYQFP